MLNMIPKIIHYCWFGGNPLPEDAQKCIASWKKYLPGYEIKEWNESNFDVNCCPYVSEAYQAKKYAFVSDYVRVYALYNYGGIYLDTDVEVKKSFNNFLNIIKSIGFVGAAVLLHYLIILKAPYIFSVAYLILLILIMKIIWNKVFDI